MIRNAILTLFLARGLVTAETLHSIRGFEFENVTVNEVTLERVKLTHDSGIGWVNLNVLTPESLKWVKNQDEYKALVEAATAEQRRADEAAQASVDAVKKEKERELLKNEQIVAEKNKNERERRDVIQKEFLKIKTKKTLWVDDFHVLENLLQVGKTFPGNYLNTSEAVPESVSISFTFEFGKPDDERTHNIDTTVKIHTIDGPITSNMVANVREYTYRERLKNPTTGKTEDLTLEFVDGFYRKAIAFPSGNTSR